MLELGGLLEARAVALEERLVGAPLPLHQRVADEQLAGHLAVDLAVGDEPVGDQRDAVQGGALVGHHRGALGAPVRLGPGALDQVATQPLGPRGVDGRDLARPQPAGLDELAGHHVGRVLPRQRTAGEDREPGAAGALVLAHRPTALALLGARRGLLALLQQPDLAEQPRQQGLVDAVGVVRRPARRAGSAQVEAHLLADLAQLGLEVLPLAHPQVVEVLALAHPPEGARAELLLLLLDVAPQVQPGEEVGLLGVEAGVLLVGLGALLGGSLAGVLQAQRGGDDQHVAQAAEALGLEHHPAQARVEGHPGQPLTQPGQARPRVLAARLQGAQLLEQLHPGGDVAPVGRLHEREAGHVAEAQAGHLQDDAGQVGAQDLRVGELGAALEVLLGVEPDRDARGHAAAAPRSLVGRGLADRLDRQPLHLGARGVARDPRDAGVDDVPDARHGQGGLGDVGGQHDAAPGVGGEDAVLLGGREPRVERHHLGAAAAGGGGQLGQGVGGVADLALAGQEDQHVAGSLGAELAHRVDDRLGLVALDRLALVVVLAEVQERSVADLDGVGAPGDLHDGRRVAVAVGEVGGEAVDVDGGRGDDQLEVGPARQQPLEVAEQEVDVERALVGLVDDDRVVLPQHPVALQLGQQDAVGHQLDPGGARGAVGEAHLVADHGLLAQRPTELVGDPLGHRAGRDAAGLGVPDQATAAPGPPVAGGVLGRAAPAELEADLRQLGGLARPGLAGDHDDLVVADRLGDVLATLGDRQLGRVGDLERGAARLGCRRTCRVHDPPILSNIPTPRRAGWSGRAGSTRGGLSRSGRPRARGSAHAPGTRRRRSGCPHSGPRAR